MAASELLDQKRDKLAEEDFSPSGPAKFLVKDLTFATDSAAGRELPSLKVSLGLFTGLTDAGLGDQGQQRGAGVLAPEQLSSGAARHVKVLYTSD